MQNLSAPLLYGLRISQFQLILPTSRVQLRVTGNFEVILKELTKAWFLKRELGGVDGECEEYSSVRLDALRFFFPFFEKSCGLAVKIVHPNFVEPVT